VLRGHFDPAMSASGNRRFRKPLRQVTMPMHGPSHYHVIAMDFVKQEVLLERAEDHHESPTGEAGLGKTSAGTKQRMLRDEFTNGLDGGKIPLGHLPAPWVAYHSN